MGLGKTLEMIALMVSDVNPKGAPNNPTLIVAPLGVMSNWSGQVKSTSHARYKDWFITDYLDCSSCSSRVCFTCPSLSWSW